jgi:rod shape determining protein RodA
MARRPQIDALNPPELTLPRKLQQLNWGLIVLISMVAAVGFAMLYSAANGDWSPWAYRQMIRYAVGLALAICIALVDLRWLMKWSYAAYGWSWRCLPRWRSRERSAWALSAGSISGSFSFSPPSS